LRSAGFEEAAVEDLAWMAWTPATGAFFVAVGLLLEGGGVASRVLRELGIHDKTCEEIIGTLRADSNC